jgi:tetratricopeptide (TPR) repeat protein
MRAARCNPQLAALACDHYHHFYHYQSSAHYLWLAETLCALGEYETANAAYTKSIFQDHFNEEALKGKEEGAAHEARAPVYAKHPLFDIAFCANIGELPSEATRRHDDGVKALLAGDIVGALSAFNNAIAIEPAHSNSYFARAKLWFAQGAHVKAGTDLEEAIRLSHLKHDSYHRFASDEHLVRGARLLLDGEVELAIADFTKALDLNRRNRKALLARAAVYRAKGNEALARSDETAANKLSTMQPDIA